MCAWQNDYSISASLWQLTTLADYEQVSSLSVTKEKDSMQQVEVRLRNAKLEVGVICAIDHFPIQVFDTKINTCLALWDIISANIGSLLYTKLWQ